VSTGYNVVLLEKDVARSQARVDSLQQDLAASLLTAPFTGIVTQVLVHVDDKLTKDAAVVTLARPGEAVFRVDMAAADASKVATGQTATIKLEGLDAPLEATVDSVQDAPRGQTGRVALLKVDWRADAPPYGTVAQVQIQVTQKNNALVIPKKALHTAGARRYVQVQSGSSRKIVNVDVGIVANDSAEITSGLTEGQIVYVGP
jgi:multidrug efflux pump subunit AcrA (membrane-fusion protein)